MNLTLVMFLKGIVLVMWASAVKGWKGYKKYQLASGDEVRIARLARLEKYAQVAFYISLAVLIPYAAFVIYVLLAT